MVFEFIIQNTIIILKKRAMLVGKVTFINFNVSDLNCYLSEVLPETNHTRNAERKISFKQGCHVGF